MEDVAYAILYPVKAKQTAKTEAWTWYRDSSCVTLDDSPQTNRAVLLHGSDLFSVKAYDDRWLKDTDLPLNVKRALWSAKT